GGRRSVGMVVRRLAVEIDPRSALSTRGPTPGPGAGLSVDEGDRPPPGWGDVCAFDGVEVATLRTDTTADAPGHAVRGPGDPAAAERRFRTIEEKWGALVGMASHTIRGPIPAGRPGPVARDGACVRDDPFNWGDPDDPRGPCGDYFPVIHVRGDAELRSGAVGQGILLVDGDLTLGDGARFRGLVVVRGRLGASGGASEVSGAVVAGSAGPVEGGLRLSFSSCALRRAGLEAGALVRIDPLERRGWIDLSGIEGLF
ncbi:MAG TPA: hypothetical protein VLL48_09120, partial [Longimicrobiales bacterium]|nr:hypothetical protein [Longimicrobiales bacterium]